MAEVRFTLLKAGHCGGHEHHVITGGARRPCIFPALVGVIEHPTRGLALFDTGYTSRFAEETASGLARIYGAITPVTFREADAVAAQLRARGLDPADVTTVILSHFHADHVAGARDFPNARFVYHEGAYRALTAMGRVRQLRHAFLAGLLPPDFEARALPFHALPEARAPHGAFPGGRDLFGDGSVVLVDLPGHALGHFGAFVQTAEAPWLLAADACWLSRAFRENLMPGRVARLLFPDEAAYRRSLATLHDLHRTAPDVRIVPAHCEEARARWVAPPPVASVGAP